MTHPPEIPSGRRKILGHESCWKNRKGESNQSIAINNRFGEALISYPTTLEMPISAMKFSRIMVLIVRRFFGPSVLLNKYLNQRLRSNNKATKSVSCHWRIMCEPLFVRGAFKHDIFLTQFIVYRTHSWSLSWSFSYFYGCVREIWCCTILFNLGDTTKSIDIEYLSSRIGKQICWASAWNDLEACRWSIANLRRILCPKPT